MEHPDIVAAMRFGYPAIEYLDYERSYNSVNHPVVGNHPIEDIYGAEIKSGDVYLVDESGRAVLNEHIRDYLTDVLGVVFYEAK